MVDRPSRASREWLARVEQAFGKCRLLPMTRSGDRGIVCQMKVRDDSIEYVREFPSEMSEMLAEALYPLLSDVPGPRFRVGWSEYHGLWLSQFDLQVISTDEIKTRIDRDALKKYCEELPDCSRFLENFFLTCEPYEPIANFENYLTDLELYGPTKRGIRENSQNLIDAFFNIVQIPEDEAITRADNIPDDPEFSHYVVERGYVIGEAKEVSHDPRGISNGHVKLWGMEEFAEYGSIESRNLMPKKGLKFMRTVMGGLHKKNP